MEENRKGPGIFYAVTGVATLVVAIIGATFAYFSAAASTGENDIKGETLDIASSFAVSAVRVNQSTTVASDNLVPTNVNGEETDSINLALSKQCVADGYTGCHVYKITATSSETLNAVTLDLELTQTGAATEAVSDWKYSIYTGTDTTASDVVTSGSFQLAATDIHAAAGETGLTGGTPAVYYLMVYLADDNAPQNETTGTNAGNLATGKYTGKVTFKAAGGQVSATFSA